MADKKNSRQIIEGSLNKGAVIDTALTNALYANDTTSLTDELMERAFLKKFGDDPRLEERAKELLDWDNVTIPTYERVFDILKVKGSDKAKDKNEEFASRMQEFIDTFPKNVKKFKDRVVAEWGENGWRTVKSMWQRASYDDMNKKIREGRAKAAKEAPLDFYGLFQVKDPLPAVTDFVASTLAPRMVEDLKQNADWKAKDLLLDVVENGLYAVPGPGWTGAVGKLGNRLFPGAARAIGRAAESLSRISPKVAAAARVGGAAARGVAGNAAAPLLAEALDAAAYTDNDKMDQRNDFSVGDVAVGTAINTAINRQLYAAASDWIRRLSERARADRTAMKNAADWIENLGRSPSERGDVFAETVRRTTEPGGVTVTKPGEISTEMVDAYRYGRNPETTVATSVTPEQYERAWLAKDVLEAINRGDIRLMDREGLDALKKRKAEAISAEATDRIKAIEKAAANTDNTEFKEFLTDKGLWDETMQLLQKDIHGEIKQKGKKKLAKIFYDYDNWKAERMVSDEYEKTMLRDIPLQEPGVTSRELFEVTNSATPHDIASRMAGTPSPEYTYNSKVTPGGIPVETVRDELDRELGSYLNYAQWHGKGPGSATLSDKARMYGYDAATSWAKNKAGRSETAKQVLGDVLDLAKQEQRETSEAPRKRRAKAQAEDILQTGLLGGEDLEFVTAVRDNPDAVKFGLKSGDQDKDNRFKIWLLSGGNDILREYVPDAYRPVWEVK